ncbi:MAG: DegV family protein [Actinomycetota bacterium]|nr:DegV family protein [Actinomycetota bacterium]
MRLTTANTALVLDSTADFPQAQQRFPNWRVVPLYVRFGDESFRDYVDLAPDEFYERLRVSDVMPSTSQPTPGDFLAVYEELDRSFERVFSLHIGGGLSGTVESARAAAREVDGDRVRVVDTGTASVAIAMLGFAIQRRLERGTSDEEVDELVARYKRDAKLLFTLDTLDFLARGGRIGRAQAWAGGLLHVKPILTIEQGEVRPIKRVRGNQKAFQEFQAEFERQSRDGSSLRVGIAQADAPKRVEALQEMVRRTRPQAQLELVTSLGPVVGTHAGPGTVGLFWFEDDS